MVLLWIVISCSESSAKIGQLVCLVLVNSYPQCMYWLASSFKTHFKRESQWDLLLSTQTWSLFCIVSHLAIASITNMYAHFWGISYGNILFHFWVKYVFFSADSSQTWLEHQHHYLSHFGIPKLDLAKEWYKSKPADGIKLKEVASSLEERM